MAKAHESSSAKAKTSRERQLRGTWCECPDVSDETIYMPDNVCPCGVDKHHYHCTTCMGIYQVG